MSVRFPRHLVPAFLLVLPLSLGACCDPSSCRAARTTFAALEPVTTRIAEFTDQQGHPPARLEDAFPEGLPANIRRIGPDRPEAFRLDLGRGEERFIGYRPGDRVPAAPATGATQLDFSYSGPGMNRCNWTSDSRAWACQGFY